MAKSLRRGWWYGNGQQGAHATYRAHRGQPSHAHAGYWWYCHPDGTYSEVHYCDHAHRTYQTAKRCGEREAAARNRTLERVRG